MARDNYDIVVEHILANEKTFYRIAFFYTREREAALDAVQNAVCRAIESNGQLKNPDAVKTWFYRILVNESLAMLRKNKKEFSFDGSNIPEPVYEEAAFDRDDSLDYAVSRLPEKMRTVVLLRYYEELPLKEIAEITGTNLSTVKTRLYAALDKLKMMVEVS